MEKIGPAAVPALVEAATDKNANVSEMAIRMLREKYADDAKKAVLGNVKEEMATMKKLEPTKDLKGTAWYSTGGSTATGAVTGSSGDGSRVVQLSFTDDKAVWTEMGLSFKKPGEGAYTLNTASEPAQIEITMGGKTYKGVYSVNKGKDSPVTMKIMLNDAGADYPKDVILQPAGIEIFIDSGTATLRRNHRPDPESEARIAR